MESIHIPVLFDEVLEGLCVKEGGLYFDGTLGGAGHTIALSRKVGPTGLIIATDRDLKAIDAAEERIKRESNVENQSFKLPIRLAQANYRDFEAVFELLKIDSVDGFLLDLGLSSDQIADRNRGFSFDSDGELDLRFDVSEGHPAYELLNKWNVDKIADIIYQYGEERFSRRIARAIVEQRTRQPIRMAKELADICRRCIPTPPWNQRIDPATRTFQALRIAVNDELNALESFLKKAPQYLKPNGRIAIISFHSLEDRIVKNAFRENSILEAITKKPIEATDLELTRNPRARSAKLRIAQRIQ